MATKYPLEDLRRIRTFREETAANDVIRCRRLVEQAAKLLEERKKQLAEYIEWRIAREEAMYQEIMQQLIQRKDLDELKVNIQILRDKELTYRERVVQAEKELAEAQATWQAAVATHQAAVKARQKLDEHKEMWAREVERELEFKQEIELEDFRTRDDDQFDDDDSDDDNEVNDD